MAPQGWARGGQGGLREKENWKTNNIKQLNSKRNYYYLINTKILIKTPLSFLPFQRKSK
jgi:hypothetical protein